LTGRTMPISTKFPQEDAKLYVITMLYYTSQWGLCRAEIELMFFDSEARSIGVGLR